MLRRKPGVAERPDGLFPRWGERVAMVDVEDHVVSAPVGELLGAFVVFHIEVGDGRPLPQRLLHVEHVAVESPPSRVRDREHLQGCAPRHRTRTLAGPTGSLRHGLARRHRELLSAPLRPLSSSWCSPPSVGERSGYGVWRWPVRSHRLL